MVYIPEYAADARIKITQNIYCGDAGNLLGFTMHTFHKQTPILIPNTQLGNQLYGELLFSGYPCTITLIDDQTIVDKGTLVLLLEKANLYLIGKESRWLFCAEPRNENEPVHHF